MTMAATDAWADAEVVLDEGQCPDCHSDTCEDLSHVSPVDDDGAAECASSPAATDIILPKPRFESASAVMAAPTREAVIAGVAWDASISVLVAESGAGKTFALLGMSAAISDGVAWQGRTTQHGSVAYVSFEGDALGLRLRALANLGHQLEHVYLLRGALTPLSPISSRGGQESPSLGEALVAEELRTLTMRLAADEKPPIRLLVVDTVRASMCGSEDSSESVSAYLRAIRRMLVQLPGAAAILAHHTGWLDTDQKKTRERGSSAFRGNCDATLYLEHADGDDADNVKETRLVLRVLKARDEASPMPLRLVRRTVTLEGTTAAGCPLTSCVIEQDERSYRDRQGGQEGPSAAEIREIDLVLLRAMRDNPDATGQREIRECVGLGMQKVAASVKRIEEAGWATRESGHGYRLTPAGAAQISLTSPTSPALPERQPVMQSGQVTALPTPVGGGDAVTVTQPGGAPRKDHR